MKKREGLIVARFKSGESIATVAAALGRTIEFVEEAIRAALLGSVLSWGDRA